MTNEPQHAAAQDAATGAGDALASMVRRLTNRHGVTTIATDELDAYAADGDVVVLLIDEPGRVPECWDMAVVLPEALKHFAVRLRAAVALPADSARLQSRFGVARLPALLFLRGGAYVGALEGMRDWAELVPQVSDMLARAPTRVPSIGIALRAADSGCH